MAGHGPAPTGRAVRGGNGGMRIIAADPMDQPELPEFDVRMDVDGEVTYQSFDWPAITRTWWSMWANSPLSAEFTSTDWSELMDTALLHAKYWGGDTKLAGELRLRVAKFGATPEDRARLKIQFAAADEAEDRGRARASRAGSKQPAPDADPRSVLRAVV
ncbi:hypothetical protein SAMN04489740_0873 [Arthrobacter alpinus]|uniref:Terminase small subunit n=1 Tax=Arthrobacter alpinus TaxID=656366 RepID=A0A1H5GXS5_9MICC|nr:hypothetical protein [Arthrobacter alpinus]SEE20304.1 hypothetical protein SAMN04489740_0873 [Arthrobacter alpinus]